MILGIGVDILHLPRLRRLVQLRPERFVTRILTKIEQEEFRAIREEAGGRVDADAPIRYLGSRWALKEACYKALYPHHKLTWQDVTVSKVDGKPTLLISDKERLKIGKAHASVSHDGEYLNPTNERLTLDWVVTKSSVKSFLEEAAPQETAPGLTES